VEADEVGMLKDGVVPINPRLHDLLNGDITIATTTTTITAVTTITVATIATTTIAPTVEVVGEMIVVAQGTTVLSLVVLHNNDDA